MSDDDILDYILQFEGGFTNNPADHGGPTKYGITAADYGRYLHLPGVASAAQVSEMAREEAVAIYKQEYIALPGFSAVSDGTLKLVIVDSGVLFGTGRACRWLQQALKVSSDGVIGKDTRDALDACQDPLKLARRVLALRLGAIADIVARDTSQVVFLRGWVSRATSLLGML